MSQVKLLESRQVYFDVKFFKLKKKTQKCLTIYSVSFHKFLLKEK